MPPPSLGVDLVARARSRVIRSDWAAHEPRVRQRLKLEVEPPAIALHARLPVGKSPIAYHVAAGRHPRGVASAHEGPPIHRPIPFGTVPADT